LKVTAMRRLLLLIASLGLVVAACATPVPPAPRFIDISMTDAMRFVPATINVAVGEAVVFQVTNDGLAVHEFTVGDAAVQNAHAAEMAAAKPGTTGHSHEGGDAHEETGVTVQPGASAVREYTFATAGTLFIGCHEPGHFAAGMVGTIVVK
jgi:uncharacterized cupredoxin-like copper-binding protein